VPRELTLISPTATIPSQHSKYSTPEWLMTPEGAVGESRGRKHHTLIVLFILR